MASKLLEKTYVKVAWYEDMWQEIKDNAVWTMGRDGGKYPDSDWKHRMVLAEHSVIRSGRLIINVYNVPTFVVNHFVRHHEGFTPFVHSKREDRSEWEDGKVPDRYTLVGLRFEGNFQAFINISRKRFCRQAKKETREVWKLIMDAVEKVEPELARCCVRECVYRGWCYEYKTCNYHKSDAFKRELESYREGINGWCKGVELTNDTAVPLPIIKGNGNNDTKEKQHEESDFEAII